MTERMQQDNTLQVYNTLTGKKEPFIPQEEGKVRMYVCGPTTYNYIHLGNARPLAVFDTVRRYLEYLGFEVTYIQNFTDVDDKIIKRAQEEEMPPLELAAKYVAEYFEDADSLNVKRATVHPKVSGHMEDIISFVAGLVEKGFAYEVEGDVYFAVEKFKEYGKLSKRSLEDLQAGARVEVDERKRHPADFALWKKAKPNEPSWPSPWGEGRPGWHIECSTMSKKYLGPTFDIHAGGYDLVFPHHENEIAQSEALTGQPMARYWLHNGFITVNQEKMSKSLGNFFLLRDITKKYAPQVVRFYLLSTHYRSPLDFDDQKLEAAQKGLERLQNSYRLLLEKNEQGENQHLSKAQGAQPGVKETSEGESLGKKLLQEVGELKTKFVAAMNDDFNTALAIAVLFDFARTINTFVSKENANSETLAALKQTAQNYRELAGVLGIELEEKENELDPEFLSWVEEQVSKRQEAKTRKDYKTADAIRDELKAKGILLEDTPQGPRWRKQ